MPLIATRANCGPTKAWSIIRARKLSSHRCQHLARDDVFQRLPFKESLDLSDCDVAYGTPRFQTPCGNVWRQENVWQATQFMIRWQRFKRIGHVKRCSNSDRTQLIYESFHI